MLTNKLRTHFVSALFLTLVPSLVSAQTTQTAVNEIRRLEQLYTEAFNIKDTATLAGMHSRGAIWIRGDGSMLVGQDTIRKVLAAEAPNWSKLTLEPESTRVVGQTAWVSGKARSEGGEPNQYLTVFRRGAKYWKIDALAVVPVRPDSAPPVTVKVSGDSQ
jgi:ketosteroid isomerase-like protein